MNKRTKHLILAFFSLLILGGTLLVPVRLENLEELKKASFGYPISFLSQDLLKDESRYFFPVYFNLDVQQIQRINGFNVLNFVLSFALIFSVIEVVIFALEEVDFRIRKKFWS